MLIEHATQIGHYLVYCSEVTVRLKELKELKKEVIVVPSFLIQKPSSEISMKIQIIHGWAFGISSKTDISTWKAKFSCFSNIFGTVFWYSSIIENCLL